MYRTAAILLTCLGLAQCAQIGGGAPRGDPALEGACRQRADRIYDAQHRGEIFSAPQGVNSPSSGAYAPGDDAPGLGQIYARDNMIQDCVRHGVAPDAAQGGAPAPAGSGGAPKR